MPKKLILLLGIVALLGGCSRLRDSNINPFNWFSGGDDNVVEAEIPVVLDPRVPVGRITNMFLDPVPGGVILRVTALPQVVGFWDVELARKGSDIGSSSTLEYDVIGMPPANLIPGFPLANVRQVGTVPQSAREIVVARYLSDQSLRGVNRIVVNGADNQFSRRP